MDEKDRELQELRRKFSEMTKENEASNKVINDLLDIIRSEVFGMSSVLEKATEELKKIYEAYSGIH